jgi:hypothetical protein
VGLLAGAAVRHIVLSAATCSAIRLAAGSACRFDYFLISEHGLGGGKRLVARHR